MSTPIGTSGATLPRESLPYPDLPVQGRSGRGEAAPATASPTATVIDRQARFTGNYRSDADLRVEGSFEGEIDCNGTVIVAEDANLSATVRARNMVIAGNASGEIICEEKLSLLSSGELRGKAQAATLVVEEGAFFEGEFKMGGGLGSLGGSFSGWESKAYGAGDVTPPGSAGEQPFAPDASSTPERD